MLIYSDYLDISLLYHNGKEIVDAYKVLEQWSFFDEIHKWKYIHFKYLIYLIERETKQYHKHCTSIENKILKDKTKQMKGRKKCNIHITFSYEKYPQ